MTFVILYPLLTVSNIFSPEATELIEAIFHAELQWVKGIKVSSVGLDHMTKMATMPIYGKNPSKIFFSRTKRPVTLKLGM